jgi:RNA recognition motif-containing protein
MVWLPGRLQRMLRYHISLEILSFLAHQVFVQEIFSQCGTVLEKRLLSKPSDPTARVYIKFENASAAQSAVSNFDKQPADGNILQVSIINSALGSRMGVKIKSADGPVDLLVPSESVMGGCVRGSS